MSGKRKTFEDYTREYVEASNALQAFAAGLPERQMTAEQAARFEKLFDDMHSKQDEWRKAFHDATII